MANLRSRPPRLDPNAFIAAAENPPNSTVSQLANPLREEKEPHVRPRTQREPARVKIAGEGRKGERAWDAPGVREDVTKPFNLRLPEPLKLKLDYIRQSTRISAHEFIMNALIPAVESEIRRLEKDQK